MLSPPFKDIPILLWFVYKSRLDGYIPEKLVSNQSIFSIFARFNISLIEYRYIFNCYINPPTRKSDGLLTR
ncbi:hypothetical protein A2Y99_04595 [Candidatus Gottesmanbacteria bacterium RBG_13_37_7]|uniref:Uncharacterized protein n=1 Tax=Candidatus Gottesmanbacteria bacterium RBG_13_37_7 TaxID=1798369 RepID=A0A1F5YGF2_9BACT|nr:MAG: hypothetical protein A2Y99_04595 [Candidatus Gottesmanbacteria bacterium RBG_13_37_7]